MAKRSLQASQEGARLARKAFDRKGWTQENLAAELELKTRQPIWRFFTCRPVERHIFLELCHILDLNWWEIAEHPPQFLLETVKDQQESSFLPPHTEAKSSVELLVEQIRANCQDWIKNQCGILRILDTSSPIGSDALYVPVDIVQISGEHTGLQISASQAEHEIEQQTGFASLKATNNEKQNFRTPAIQAMQQQTKLRVLGKPGSGKTALLKYLALQCIQGTYGADKVPVLIHLGSFATYAEELGKCSLLDFICYELSGRGVDNTQMITALLTEGKFLLLLDALDEVSEPANYALYQEITRFAERYYKNQFVITARPASDRFEFSQFTDVAIGDFTEAQVAALSDKWFEIFSKPAELNEQPTSARFLRQLRLPENQSIAALARLPLFFHAIAQLFQKQGDLALYRLEIYETCLNLLLERWDRSRGVNRNASKPDVPISIKQAVLMQLAATGFQQHRCYFERREIVQWIEEYLYQLHPDASNPTTTQAMSKAVFAALEHAHGLLIEETHGIFSFSFLGFQNYFAALWIAQCVTSDEDSDGSLAMLAHHVADPQWQEVVLLSCALTAENGQLVGAVNQALDRLTTEQGDLVSFMNWTQQIHLKSSIYQQMRAGFVLWQLILRTPVLLDRYAYALLVLHALVQQLLLEVLLDNLFKSFLMLNREDLSGLEKTIALLERAITLSNQAGYDSEFQALQLIRRKLAALNQPSQQPASRQFFHSEWTKQLQQVVADWYKDDRYRNLTGEQQRVLRHYGYLSHLLAECMNLRSRRSKYSNPNFPCIVSLYPGCLKKTFPSPSVKKSHYPLGKMQVDKMEEIRVS